MVQHSWATGPRNATADRACTSEFSVGNQECNPMKIVKGIAVIMRGGAQQAIPKNLPILAPRTQPQMLLVSDSPKLVQAEFPDDLCDLGGHPEQDCGKADVLSNRIPCNREHIPGQVHGNDPRKYARSEIPEIQPLTTLRFMPPAGIAELKVGENERASARSAAHLRVRREPKSSVTTQDLRQCVRIPRAGCTGQILKVALIELKDEFKARPANPRGWNDRSWSSQISMFPGSLRHYNTSESRVINLLLRSRKRTSHFW